MVGSCAKKFLTIFFLTLQKPFNDEEQCKLENVAYNFNQRALIYLAKYTQDSYKFQGIWNLFTFLKFTYESCCYLKADKVLNSDWRTFSQQKK